jgi:YebC/PmpR family DNA-binding regulatory protein
LRGSSYKGAHMGAQWKQKFRVQAADARGRIFSKLSKEIIIAAKSGADPEMNPRLRMAIEAAKKASMTRDTLERAIKKGAGLLDEKVNYESVTYEGFAPHQVPVIVECVTDNRARTATNVRMLFRKGQLGQSGSVSWDFKREGFIEAAPGADAKAEHRDAESVAIEAGAQDLEAADEGVTRFFTEPSDLDTVTKALTAMHWTVSSAKIGWRPKNAVSLDETARGETEAFLQALDEDDDVQEIYVGLA